MAATKPRFGGAQIMEYRYSKESENRKSREESSFDEMESQKENNVAFVSEGRQNVNPNISSLERQNKVGNSVPDDTLYKENSAHCRDVLQATAIAERYTPSARSRNMSSKAGQLSKFTEVNTTEKPKSNVELAVITPDNEPAVEDISNKLQRSDIAAENGNDTERLLQILKDLGIFTSPKPYTRMISKDKDVKNKSSDSKEEITFNRDRKCDTYKNKNTSFSEHTSKVDMMDETHSLSADEANVVYCKNLFLKDRKGQFYIVVVTETSEVDLKVLKGQLNAHRNLSFGDEQALKEVLRLEPGGVTPFAVMHESAKNVRVAIDDQLTRTELTNTKLAFHPLNASLQVEITFPELRHFVESFEKTLEILNDDVHDTVTPGEAARGKKGGKSSQRDSLMVRAPLHDRKGKLRSYIKKRCNVQVENEEPKKSSGEADKSDIEQSKTETTEENDKLVCSHDIVSSYTLQSSSKSSRVLHSKETPTSSCGENSLCKVQKKSATNVCDSKRIILESQAILPEVLDFINSLNKYNVSYKAIDLACSDSTALGPSVGCKCFLLKDRRQNFYFIVSHEFYELDHGRLKKALKPKKKLDEAEPAEIMTVLRTDPARVTPFAYINADTSCRSLSTFFTDKISYGNLILCIQHPFALGHRIVMKSSELQRYLIAMGAEIGWVEEKYWPARYNTIFSQFQKSQSGSSFEITSELNTTHSQQHNHNSSSESTDLTRDLCHHEITDAKIPSSQPGMNTTNCTRSLAQSSLEGVSFFVVTIWTNISKLWGKHIASDSSVDPPQNNYPDCSLSCSRPRDDALESHQESVVSGTTGLTDNEEEATCLEELAQSASDSSETFDSEPQNPNRPLDNSEPKPEEDDREKNQVPQIPRAPNFKKMIQTVTLTDIINHLDINGVTYQLNCPQNDHPSLNAKESQNLDLKDKISEPQERLTSGNKDEAPLSTEFVQRMSIPKTTKFSTAGMSTETYGPGNKNFNQPKRPSGFDVDRTDTDEGENTHKINHCQDIHELTTYADSETEDEDCAENCRMVHMYDRFGSSYLVIGGESDRIGVRRFCRRFQIHTKLFICDDFLSSQTAKSNAHRLRKTPFSIAILNDSSVTPCPREINVVLTTSIYIESNTALKFTLDENGSVLTLTAEEFEKYARKVGFNVWYMP